MGEKRAWKGKYLLFYYSCLLAILFLESGCATTSNLQKRWHAQQHLENAEELMMKGDYDGALIEDGDALGLYPNISPGDIALFHMGLVWSHPNNPKRDYKRSLKCFQRLIQDFPTSKLKENATIQITAILELDRREREIKGLNREIKGLNRDIKNLKGSVGCLKTRVNEYEETINTLKTATNTFQETINALKETINTLKQQLIKLKEIDIRTEEKRRKRLSKD